MRAAVFGGSFDPIHIGHLLLADEALSLGYGRVIFVPAWRSPFKPEGGGAEGRAAERLEMIAASIACDPRMSLDDCEIRRESSYAAETLEDVIRRYEPEGKPGLLIGDDLLADFPDWRRSADILEMADVVVGRRSGSKAPSPPFPCLHAANEANGISSSMVRERIAGGGAWRRMVPEGARAVIERRGLYGLPKGPAAPASISGAWPWGGAAGGASPGAAARVEEAARETLGFARFLHSRNTALLAWDMCLRFGLDPAAGYLAGIGHDLAKRLGDGEQIRLARAFGREITELEMGKPSLLHGSAAAALLRDCFGVRNHDILEAVAKHTLPGGDMGPLAKTVYVADKLEVGREGADRDLRRLAFAGGDLDEIFGEVVRRRASSIRSRKLRLSEETIGLLEKIKAPGAV